MAGRGNELGVAYYSLVPSMDGTAAAVNSQLGVVTGAGARAGRAGGAALGAGLIGGLKVAGVVGAALGIAGIAGETTQYFSDALRLSSDLQESANAINVSFGDQADGIARLGQTAAERLGLSNIAFNSLAVRFSSFAETIAGEGGDVVGVIDDLTTRGSDFASVYNLEVSDALALFQSGLAGETEPLRRYGIDLSAAAVEAFALANGIGESDRALTESEKVQARYALLLEETEKVQGDFANTSTDLANSQRITNARFEDAQAAIGEALLPAAEKFSAWMLEDGVPLVEKLVDLFIRFEPAISATADVVLGLLDANSNMLLTLFDIFDAMDDGKITVDELRDAYANMPEPILDAIIGINQFLYDTVSGFHNFAAGGLNNIIGFINRFLDVLRPAAAAVNQLLGTNIRIPRLQEYEMRGPVSFEDVLRGSGAGNLRGVDAGSLPVGFAEGGLVSARPGGIVANIGEGRYDEVVLPLSPSVLRDLGESIGGAGDRPIYMDGSIVGVLRQMAGQEASLVFNHAVTELGFDVRAGGVAA